MPNPSPAPLICDGLISGSDRFIINNTFEQCMIANTTVVQATNPTSATNLMTAALLPGTVSRVGQTLVVTAAGIVNLTTSTSTATFAVTLGGVTLASFTTGAYALSLNLSWNVSVQATVVSVDQGGNVVFEAHGQASGALTTAAGAITAYNDTNAATLSAIAAASPLTLAVTGFLGTGNAASFINQRQLLIEVYN